MTKATTPRSYAASVNQRYEINQSNMVSIKDRWNQSLASLPVDVRNSINSRLNAVIKIFQRRFPTIKSVNDPDFRICKAIPVSMATFCLDTTIQRILNCTHVLDIIEHFLPYQVMPIQVYRASPADLPSTFDPNEVHWASWDGQHTIVALWIIATMIFKQDPKDVVVPVVEYDMRNRLECRKTFIANNSKENKLVIDHFDLMSQKVFGVKLDNVTDPDWEEIADKQDLLASYELFFTDPKINDHHQPGAFTRVKELFNTNYDVLEDVCVYTDQILTYNARAINAKEFPIISAFFAMARSNGIEYEEEEVRSLADLCHTLFQGDFDEAGPFWAQVGAAYVNWHTDFYQNYPEDERPGIRLNKDVPQGLTFFWYQLKHSWKDSNGNPMRLPRLSIVTNFRADRKDLF